MLSLSLSRIGHCTPLKVSDQRVKMPKLSEVVPAPDSGARLATKKKGKFRFEIESLTPSLVSHSTSLIKIKDESTA